MNLRERLWRLRSPPVKRRHKLWTLRLRLKGPWRGPFDGYLRGRFMHRVQGAIFKTKRYLPKLHLDRFLENAYE